jgi:uncharacterized membrane protein YfcA
VDALTELGIMLSATAASVLGTMVGLGGGVFFVPVLAVFFGVPLKTAVAASAVSVVANSLSGASVYLRYGMANIRLSLLLLITTSAGAVIGGLLVVVIAPGLLRVVLGLALLGMAVAMWRRRPVGTPPSGVPDPFGLRATYHDPALDIDVTYVPQKVPHGMALSSLAGIVSGMLGIGGGAIQVPVMNTIMRVPLKAAVATSVLTVGATVVASAFIYYAHDLIDLSVTVPAVLGVVLGSQSGARLARHVRSAVLARVLIVALVYLALTILLQAAGITLPGTRS